MIKHLVLLNWKKGVSETDITAVTDGFARMADLIDIIRRYQFGPDAGLYKGNADYALVAEFNNAADLKAYVNHPDHQALMKEVIGPLLDSYQSVQFEMQP